MSWPAKTLDWWYKERNLSAPDGRTVRDRLQNESEAERIAEKVKLLLDQKLLLHEIAAQLRCCRDTVTQAIRHWYGSRASRFRTVAPDVRKQQEELRE